MCNPYTEQWGDWQEHHFSYVSDTDFGESLKKTGRNWTSGGQSGKSKIK